MQKERESELQHVRNSNGKCERAERAAACLLTIIQEKKACRAMKTRQATRGAATATEVALLEAALAEAVVILKVQRTMKRA